MGRHGAGDSTSVLARRCFRSGEAAGSLIDLGWGRSIRPFDGGAGTRAAVHEGVGDRCGLSVALPRM